MCHAGGAENDGHELTDQFAGHLQGMKMADRVAGHENAGHENARHETSSEAANV